jgi:hypothetical protein
MKINEKKGFRFANHLPDWATFKQFGWCHDTQYNDIQFNDTQYNGIQHNDTQHKGLICDTQHIIYTQPLC